MSTKAQGPFCPGCDKPAVGNFCQNCGTKLGGRFCNQCGGKVSGGAKFCNQCGNDVGSGGGGGGGARKAAAIAGVGSHHLAWWIAGGAMFVAIMILGINMVQPAGPGAPIGPAVGVPVAGSGTPPDLSQMTPIEAADRLFNRVMQAVSDGDSAQAQAFVPMAIGAYDLARPLNHDGLFHLSMLNRTAMNLEAALDNALEILEQDPDHLLALAAAAEAAIELGLGDEAEVHYQHIFEIYDTERTRALTEYDMHSAIVTVLKQDAERYLAGR